MLLLPRTPNRNEPIIDWAREVTAYLRAITPLAGRGTRLDRTANGVRIHSSGGGAGGGGSSGGGTAATGNDCFALYEYKEEDTGQTKKSFKNCYFSIGGKIYEAPAKDVDDFLPGGDVEEGFDYGTQDKPYVYLRVRMRPASDHLVGETSIEACQRFSSGDSIVPGSSPGDNLISMSQTLDYYIKPLYKFTHEGDVAVDYRNMPVISSMEI